MNGVGEWVGWSSVFVAMGVWRVSYTCFLDPDGFTTLSTSTTAVLHEWVDRFVGVTVVLRSSVRL